MFEMALSQNFVQNYAITFPGQGSQTVGMGKLIADEYPEAQAIFDEVNEALGESLSSIIWEGPVETLTLTSNAQPALMAVSLAVLRAMEARGFNVGDAKFVAGHSLGEYSALAASGAISVSDTAKLLRIRGNAMQDAVPVGVGAMAAIIGLDGAILAGLCSEQTNDQVSAQIANDNGGGQLVISGHKAAIDNVCEAAKEAGAKRALLLPVSAPFHSILMKPAAEEMREALESVEINEPCIPLIANVLAVPVTKPDDIRKHLVEQVTGQVRWNESVGYMAANGVEGVLEIGAGKVLTGLARRIDKSLVGKAINTPTDIEALLS
jgi:[acyl-carrier-protein] S-malonyltransferase